MVLDITPFVASTARLVFTSKLAMLLNPDQRSKIDRTDDALFYDQPRFVTHVDAAFIARLTALYQQRLKPQTRILDLMSSWVSHLPAMEFKEVVGHGLNAEELVRNPRLNSYFVQNLNQDMALPYKDGEFAAVLNTVSVQYLQYPEAIFAEICRVLEPGGVAIVSFSNRMFPNKAINAWRDGGDEQHLELVSSYFRATPGFSEPEVVVHRGGGILPWLSMTDPFYAVIAHKL
jgi:SAM-dependent methyltransferase